jgi:hypothetical protein
MTKIDTSKKNRIVFTKIQSMEKSNFVSKSQIIHVWSLMF